MPKNTPPHFHGHIPALLLFISLILCILPGCRAISSVADTNLPQSYYLFMRAQYEELDHKDDQALSHMKQASTELGRPYYLEMETAKMLARKGRIEESFSFVRKAIEERPDDPEARLFAGYLASVTGQWDEAEKNYLEALRIEPNNDEAISFLGAMYAESGRLDEASDAFKRLESMTPTSYLPDYFLGRVAHRRGNIKEAIGYFKRSVVKKPDFVESLVELAMLYEQTGDLKNAEKTYRQIIRYQPNIPMAKARLARILIKTGKRAEAINLIEEVSGLHQSSEEAGLTIGLMFLEEGLYQQASTEFAQVLKKNKDNDQARYLLAVSYSESGNDKGAKDLLRKISPQSDEYVDSVLFISSILVKEGKSIEALEILTGARRNNPSSPILLVATGRIMEELDHLTQARDLYLEGIRLFPDSADVFFSLGAVEDRLGKKDECIKFMQKAVELDPNFADALNYLAYTWAELNTNLKEALTLALKANTLKPDNGYFLDTLAWIYYRMNDISKALPLLERAVSLSEENPVVMEHLGDIYIRLGRGLDARRVYQRAVERGHETPEAVLQKLNDIQNP
ncbi:MAG: tetratricopeptide repeat protein [Deltaproteobacteria bacterium]|jgi:tetratricopeptide (TPR) repeat protein|nr:tetratricopeptide repeat protein [Deltaproteobacteria bacterium]